jgi:hypothetical protein
MQRIDRLRLRVWPWPIVAVLVAAMGLGFHVHASVAAARPAAETKGTGDSLSRRIEAAIELTGRRHLSTNRHTPWQIVHGIKAFKSQLEVKDGPNGEFINAVDFLCGHGTNRQPVFEPTPYGLKTVRAPGMEGHPDQFLSALAQAGGGLDHPIQVKGRTYSVADVLSQTKHDYHHGQESSWTLIALTTYLSLDATWSNMHGDLCRIEDVLETEVRVEPTGAACGGTHNLYALAYALARYEAEGNTPTGVWQGAVEKLNRYRRLTESLQNRDGSLSSNYYGGRGSSADAVTRLETTGHTLEWLTLALSEEELDSPWVMRAVESLLVAFERTSDQPVDCGALYHAARALVQYHERRFGELPQVVAQRQTDPVLIRP